MDSKIEIAQELVIKDLNIEGPGIAFSNLEKLENWLTGEIALLMDQDFERLMNVLYRIDVGEDKTKLAYAASNPANELAKLIIERELQKVATRKKYRNED